MAAVAIDAWAVVLVPPWSADVKHWAYAPITRCLVLTLTLWLFSGAFALADWRDWWRTPEQQAKDAFDNNDTEALNRLAPDQVWKGIAEHKSADYEAAATTFNEEVTRQDFAGNTQQATRALYNRGVSEVRLGQYEKAVETFEHVLERNPQFEDAEHNRDIARQLIQQQQQQQQSSSQPQDGDEANDGESQDQTDQPTPENDGQQSESGEQEQSGSEQNGNSEQAESGEQQDEGSDESGVESEAQKLQDQQAARDALQAEAQAGEAQAGDDSDDPSDPDEQVTAAQREEPLSEIEQATEQWLRRIPDDPEGLLRRKLEQSHRSEYPEVRDAQEPW